ncbi:MAG: glycosyltransferase [Eubacteriales bacterium]
MSLIVHHGGAGTTAEALRAGKPNVIVPFIVDQQFWGRRVQALGAGSRADSCAKADRKTACKRD